MFLGFKNPKPQKRASKNTMPNQPAALRDTEKSPGKIKVARNRAFNGDL